MANNAFNQWLRQLNTQTALQQLLNLCRHELLYIINNAQQIVYWSEGLAQLTGFSALDINKQLIKREYCIHGNEEIVLTTLTKADGQSVVVNKTAQLLYDNAANYCGALVLMTVNNDIIAPLQNHKQNFQGIISRSPAMRAVFQIIENAADTLATVLVRGESGSGKELVAKAIHQLSSRKNAPFLAINCAALSSNLLESELFGHVRGAFTGAIKDHNGLFQRAHGGTLFLDEVAELPLDLQAKLLRVVQEKNYLPVGGTQTRNVDVRLVAATHRSLREQVKKGLFREDLMYRLRVVPLFIPPLRERREDIGLLLWHFIALHNNERGRRIEKIEPPAMRLLLDYAWPGNVRELHNVIEYAFAVGRGTVLRLSELPPEFREIAHDISHYTAAHETRQSSQLTPLQEAERIRLALIDCDGAISQAARSLNMSRATFWRKRKLYQL